jgi:4a-hydroxytetrahydrobiopterin dehydratase
MKQELKPLEPAEVKAALAALTGWSGDEHGLKKTVTFADFRKAMRFMQACVEGIEQRNHHPVWCNKYNSIDIHLDTFDAGHRVTKKDVDLAQFLDSVLRQEAG